MFTYKLDLPRAPMWTVGPSTLVEGLPGAVKAVDGETDRSATLSSSSNTGAKKAKSASRRAVKDNTGAR